MKKDIDNLARVQRRATQLIPELRILSYEDGVQQCKLTTLETRRVRGDQIEVFKITHGIEGLDSGMFFKYRTDNGTRGHRWALVKERCKLDIRKYAFSQRTINEWNRLAGECVNATSVNMFKNKIDNYFKRSGYVSLWARSITGHSISQCHPCPVPSCVPNTIGTWGGNSVKFS